MTCCRTACGGEARSSARTGSRSTSNATSGSFFRKGSRWVETLFYKYEVIQRRAGRIIQVVRYDNVQAQRGHPDAHHRHVFDPDGSEIEPPEHLGSQRWPNLGQVLDEAHEYWCRQHPSSR